MESDMKSILENTFINTAKVFGKAETDKLIEKAFMAEKSKAESPKVEKAKAEKPKNEEEKEENTKRISRMTPTLANQLKSELMKVGITFSDDDKKGFDKIKKEFVAHIDGLTNDDFSGKNLADHMRDFAKLKNPAPAEEKEEEKPKKGKAVKKEDPAPAEKEEKPKKGKAAKKEDPPPAVVEKKKLWDEMNEVKAPSPPSNAAHIHNLTLDELRGIEMLATPEGGPMGVYWDADDGRWVRGPEQDDDEDLVEKKFKGKTYAIGETTGRIYETTDDRDVFVGFAGVGAFRELK